MRNKTNILILILGIFFSNVYAQKTVDKNAILKDDNNYLKFHKLKKLSVIGDFDGDGKQDTLFEHNYSKLTKTEIENAADPFQIEWDSVVKWFYKQKPDLYLRINIKNLDKLHLGEAHGLYCLINIGDNNADGKDEIAIVIDKLDFSNVNNCFIYTLCDNTWILLKQFRVHESSFDFTEERMPIFNEILDYLEVQNGEWVYRDYLQEEYDSQEDVGKMKPLKLDKCK